MYCVFGQNNGTIDMTVGGMTDPLTYDWSGPSSFTSSDEDIMDLFAGEYTLTYYGCIGMPAGRCVYGG